MFQTVSGSLSQALEVRENEVLLIRGGTSSIGMLACQLAKHLGLKVISTTRKPEKKEYLKANGTDLVIIDNGNIKEQVKKLFPDGVDKVLELIGTRTLKDSLKCIKPGGMVCMTGILGSEWTLKEFTPMGDIPSLGRLTVYMGEAGNLQKESLQEFINAVESGDIRITIDRTFKLDEIVDAHKYMFIYPLCMNIFRLTICSLGRFAPDIILYFNHNFPFSLIAFHVLMSVNYLIELEGPVDGDSDISALNSVDKFLQ